MQKIHQLPDTLIAKIAAGEVIERPAFAVKELIENAVDAGADVIEIHIEDAGLKGIRVIDNGEGMSEEDIRVCFLPHTTSKLDRGDDLIGIKTLGFRGEALSSIAAIANLSIQSLTKDSIVGTEIVITQGKIQEIKPIGMPKGTIVTVDNLFSMFPARKKFQKTEKTEFRHITEIVMQYALSYPSTHFLLTHNKKVILDLPKKKTVVERLSPLLGESIVQSLIPIRFEEGYITVTGFLGKPQSASKQNQKQYLFVNNRSISDRMISLAIREAYGTLLPATSTPIFVLHITTPHELLDINIHPRKEHIAFLNAKEVFSNIKQAVTETLAAHNLTFNLAQFKQETSAKTSETVSFAGQLLKDTVLYPEKQTTQALIRNAPFIQVEKTYIFSVSKTGVVFIDQHAAHERILYEQYVEMFHKKKKQSSPLIKPQTVHLSVTDTQLLNESLEIFSQMGFTIESSSEAGSGLLIRTIPNVFLGRDTEKIIQDMLVDLANDSAVSMDLRTNRMLTYLSCRSAVKAGDRLSTAQMKTITKKLDLTKNNATCPHGRPTKITLTTMQLHTLFKRL